MRINFSTDIIFQCEIITRRASISAERMYNLQNGCPQGIHKSFYFLRVARVHSKGCKAQFVTKQYFLLPLVCLFHLKNYKSRTQRTLTPRLYTCSLQPLEVPVAALHIVHDPHLIVVYAVPHVWFPPSHKYKLKP
jgi:hypothetical protein